MKTKEEELHWALTRLVSAIQSGMLENVETAMSEAQELLFPDNHNIDDSWKNSFKAKRKTLPKHTTLIRG